MDTLFFIVSKVAWALLSPLNLMVLITLTGIVMLWRGRQRWGRLLSAIGLGLLLINWVYPVGDLLIRPLEMRFERPAQPPMDVDGIIVLGGGEELSRSLSWEVPLVGLAGDRYVEAAWLARHIRQVPVYFAGGSGSVQLQGTAGEGSLAQSLLTRLGVARSRLVIESVSRNTWENFRNLKPLLHKPNGRYLLITSAYHMPRSVGIARRLGIEVVPWPTDYRSRSAAYRHVDFDFFDHLKSLEPALKEWIGLTVYYWTGKTDAWLPTP